MSDPGSIPMDDPLAYFMTWTTYGTWLPGDERGWVKSGRGFQVPNMRLQAMAQSLLVEGPCYLSADQRKIVEDTIRRHCEIRGWTLLAVNCRTNHVHLVVTADGNPDTMMEQFKAWCTRFLKEREREAGCEVVREHWWTEKGSARMLNDMASVDAAVIYVVEGQ